MPEKDTIINSLILLGGLIYVIWVISLYFNEKSLRNYVENSHKAYFWKKMFGVEKTITLCKVLFLPLGIIIGCIVIFMFGQKLI